MLRHVLLRAAHPPIQISDKMIFRSVVWAMQTNTLANKHFERWKSDFKPLSAD